MTLVIYIAYQRGRYAAQPFLTADNNIFEHQISILEWFLKYKTGGMTLSIFAITEINLIQKQTENSNLCIFHNIKNIHKSYWLKTE